MPIYRWRENPNVIAHLVSEHEIKGFFKKDVVLNPGEAALRAALEPLEGDWLYYVLQDTAGNHFFTSSYEEFLEAKENQPSQ